MPVSGRFNGVLLRHGPTFEFTQQGLRSIPSANALQLRRHVKTLSRQETMPSASGRAWSTLSFDVSAHAWDAAHLVADAAVASGGDDDTYAEPNLEFTIPDDLLIRSASAGKPCEVVEGARLCMWPPAPTVGPPDWHLDSSGLRVARADAAFQNGGPGATGFRVRIGHLDTGYSEHHETKPRGLRVDLARNVLADPPTGDAIDPANTTATLSSPGHGTATLGILAGASASILPGATDLGGIPFAEIVPVRMSDFVWHIWTAVIPKAIQWALQTQCNVINLSHGGLATRAWVDAVNAAYDAGCVICAASGDNFGGLPTTDVVWPARFRRVIAVAGVTYDQRPYFNNAFGIGVMEGNFGPLEAMSHAVAAYTPNILWPKCKDASGAYTVNAYDLDGGGTSASTPQVTAAVALYLQKYETTLMAMPGWQRIETIRKALHQSTQPGVSDPLYFGAGCLDAERLLQVNPTTIGTVTSLDADEITFELLRHLPGWSTLRPGQQAMLEVEANQIAAVNPFIWRTVTEWEAHESFPQGAELVQFLNKFKQVTSPRPSNLLYHLLDDATHL